MLDMYANKNKMMDIHNQSMNSTQSNQSSGDPLLGALGSIAGTAVGTAVGGPMGGQVGGALGGQLGGTGTVDPTKLATSMATGAVGGELTGALSDTIGEGMTAASLGTELGSDQTKMLYDQINDVDPDLRLTGFFSKGGPISYAACGGKMKYRAGGGPISASELEAQAIALNNDEALEEAMRMKQIEAQRAAQYNALNVDPDLTPGELYNLEQEMKRREMMERQYEMNRRAHEEAGEEMPEMQQFGPMNPRFYKKGGNVSDEMRVVLDNEDLISRMKINQYGPQANMIREQDLYTNEERYGPLKAVKYKSSGGEVYEKQYHNPLMK